MIVVFVWLMLAHDPDGGQPLVVVDIERADQLTTGSVDGTAASQDIQTDQTDGHASPGSAPYSRFDGGNPDLIETSRYGPLPRATADNTPLSAYARPLSQAQAGASLPKIAFIIGDLGRDPRGSATAVNLLPADVTLAVSANSPHAQAWLNEARAEGHEVLLQTGSEPGDGLASPAAGGHLILSTTRSTPIEKLHWQMSRAVGYFGIASTLHSTARADIPELASIFHDLRTRGLGYFELGGPGTAVQNIAQAAGLHYAEADLVIDAQPSPAAIEASLNRLVEIARVQGIAIGSGSASQMTVEQLSRWLERQNQKSFVVVPASAVLETPTMKNASDHAR
ncbi:divergent polysaccharide deacetylase family protein [Rhodoligotrophos ferricapiens]|uniref:divergent polysaccharide deacetylase family protein n=1 Tax=Rhodoligotrophos ferricapiens TaxID=3069264 RepID=UPI00315CD07D